MKLIIFSAAEIGLYCVQAFELCLGYLILCVILESPFYCRYNAHFLFEQTGFNIFFGIFVNIFFAYFQKNVFRQFSTQGETEDKGGNCSHQGTSFDSNV
jgi:hypothetical protein